MIRGLMTDDEWAVLGPFLTTASLRGGRPPANHRRVLDGVFWICRNGATWRECVADDRQHHDPGRIAALPARKAGFNFRHLAVLAAGSPPKSISAAMPQAFPSVSY